MTKDTAQDQARAQYESIQELLAAASMDWDRYQELIDMRDEHEMDMREATSPRPFNAVHPNEAEELADMEDIALAADVTSEDEAQTRIYEDPLSVQVRSDWTDPGATMVAGEFMILLCTGGPAVRIVGELDDNGDPARAWMEFQDWGTPWTRYGAASQDELVRYASYFFQS
jgi:hypothetical protein